MKHSELTTYPSLTKTALLNNLCNLKAELDDTLYRKADLAKDRCDTRARAYAEAAQSGLSAAATDKYAASETAFYDRELIEVECEENSLRERISLILTLLEHNYPHPPTRPDPTEHTHGL